MENSTEFQLPAKLVEAAAQGDANAQSMLGVMFHVGQGVPKDFQQAAKWFTHAAEQGDAMAQSVLGVMYVKGEGNLEGDLVMAHMWFTLAAANGDKDAANAREDIAKELTAEQLDDAQRRLQECLRKIEGAKQGIQLSGL